MLIFLQNCESINPRRVESNKNTKIFPTVGNMEWVKSCLCSFDLNNLPMAGNKQMDILSPTSLVTHILPTIVSKKGQKKNFYLLQDVENE